jgi:uncharacterized protein (DUF608 family)
MHVKNIDDRRQFLKSALGTLGATPVLASGIAMSGIGSEASGLESSWVSRRNIDATNDRPFNGSYEGCHLDHLAFPLGGLGAGMVCLEGTGALSHVSVCNHPDIRKEPGVYAALSVKGVRPFACVLEGPVPRWKLSPQFPDDGGGGDTLSTACWGLPRYGQASFKTRFPFAEVSLMDAELPIEVLIRGWSPFEAGDADHSSLPVAGLEYELTNRSTSTVEGVFSFNAVNFMATAGAGGKVLATDGGFVLHGAGTTQKPWEKGDFAVWVDDASAKANLAWFRGGSADSLIMAWRDVAQGAYFERAEVIEGEDSPGATLFVPLTLAAGDTKIVKLHLAWYVAGSDVRWSGGGRVDKLIVDGAKPGKETYRPWYAGRFGGIDDVVSYWRANYSALKEKSQRFSQCFYDSTLPPEVIEAVAANLTIMKSPTVLRETGGRLWGWEGSGDTQGSGPGSCTHVWNYAQALPHLFPELERTLRETEFGPSLGSNGHQVWRAAIPIRASDQDHTTIPAADGQLGSIIRVYREWRISGDTEWLRSFWPKVRLSLDFCIRTWDPEHKGWLEGFQHNTYDMPLLGPNGFCSSIYLAALKAAILMGQALGDNVSLYSSLFEHGKRRVESKLFDGEYFIQKVELEYFDQQAPKNEVDALLNPSSPEARALLAKEGPEYQYGNGCLSDGVIGAWYAFVSGIDELLDADKVDKHLQAVYRYNFKEDLSRHANLMRTSFACGGEGGLLICTWPKGSDLSLPNVYSTEVWTGVEYQVASHLIAVGRVAQGLDIVRACRRRYDGRIRNPFNEVEQGHWYARAMSSYALLQALSGARYDAVDKVLHLRPAIQGDFRCFLSTATGYGTVGVRSSQPFVDVVSGEIPYIKIAYASAGGSQ